MSEERGPISVAKRAIVEMKKGALDQTTYTKLQTRLALEMFPDAPNDGVALAKFYNTAVGKEMLNAGLTANYEAMQKRNALGTG